MMAKSKTINLCAQINDLLNATPTNFDSDDENETTKAKVVDRYEEDDFYDFETSTLRKQNIISLDQIDKRYAGKKVSRKDIYGSESEEEANESSVSINCSEEESEGPDENHNKLENDYSSNVQSDEEKSIDSEVDNDLTNDEENTEDEDSCNSDDKDEDKKNPLYQNQNDSNFQYVSGTNNQAEIEKGTCVRNQLKMWENLLEVRIKLQKCVQNSNKMPQYNVYSKLKSDKRFIKDTNDAKKQLSCLLNNLLQLQSTLWKNNLEMANLESTSRKRKGDEIQNQNSEDEPMDEEIPSDTENEAEDEKDEEENDKILKKKRKLSDYERILEEKHSKFKDYRNSIIKKWNDKTRIAVLGSKKGSNQQPIIEQINYILSDKSKLVKRTQLKRSEYEIVGKSSKVENEDGRHMLEYDTEIYDDDDFYHQLLRELIEYKSVDITDPIQLSKQWIQLQNMRSKMKRKIDTRATKGRRIRYNVHQKLINYMAPVMINDTWSNFAKDELYSSLFGKIKSLESDEKKEQKIT